MEFEIKEDPNFAKAAHDKQSEKTTEIMKSVVETYNKLNNGEYFTVPNAVLSIATVKKHLKIMVTDASLKTKVVKNGKKAEGLRIGKLATTTGNSSPAPTEFQ